MTAWDDFYTEVMSEIKRMKDEDSCEIPFFRGEFDNKNKLLPSLFTSGIDLRLEGNLFLDYKAYSATLRANNVNIDNSWKILYEMRHHGLPTRLLDWTGSFGIALFFALNFKLFGENKSDSSACIWILDPYKLNRKSIKLNSILAVEDLDGFDYTNYFNIEETPIKKNAKQHAKLFKNPIAIYPLKSHPRILSQDGYFTIHGTNELPLERICNKCLKKIDIPDEAILDATNYLKHANINQYSLFPDLDGLCRHLKQKYLDETYRLMGLG